LKEIFEMDVYRLAEQLSDRVWFAFDTWSEKTRRTIGYQIITSSDSIAANIAEGYGRFSVADRKRFYLFARGSFEETKVWLRKLIRRGIIRAEDEVESYKKLIDELGPKLNAFIKTTVRGRTREEERNQ
jgi:four helix bundle protein